MAFWWGSLNLIIVKTTQLDACQITEEFYNLLQVLLLTNRQSKIGRNIQPSHSTTKYNPKKEARPTEIGLNGALCWDTRRKPLTGSSQLECYRFPRSWSQATYKHAQTTNPQHKLSSLLLFKSHFYFDVKGSMLLLNQDRNRFSFYYFT